MDLSPEREAYFPRLPRGKYRVTSEATATYNCIAHAAGRDDAWWWPEQSEGVYWPEDVPKIETLECFIEAFAREGYTPCEGHGLDPGSEKIAFYADLDGTPTHAARQLPHGAWTSKLGEWEDIEHASLDALEADAGNELGYGQVVCIMKRPV